MAAALLGSGGWWDSLWPCYSCCRKIWIPSSGQFSPQCLGVVAHIPFWVAILAVTLRYGLGPAWSAYRPVWLRRFAAEQDELSSNVSDQESGAGSAGRKSWTAWTLSLLFLNVGAAALGAFGALVWPEHAQLCMTPIIPCRPRVVPGAVFVINSVLLFVVASILALMPDALSGGWPRIISWVAGVALPLASIILMLSMPMRDPLLDSTGIGKPSDEPTAKLRSPEDIITLWQWMTVSLMGPLIKIGYKRQLLSGTVFVRLLKANGVDLLITTFLGVLETSLELADPVLLKQLLGALTAQEPDVRAAIVYAGITLFARLVKTQSGVFSLWYCRRNYERSRGELITMIHDKTLRRKAFTIPSGHDLPAEQPEDQQEDSSSSSTPGISTSTTLTDDESSNHDSTDADADSTSSEPTKFQKLRSLVHRGYASLNPRPIPPPATTTTTTTPDTPFTPASTGKVLNLLRNDSYEVAQRFWEAPNLTTKPLNFLLSLFLLWRILGPASLFGILILLAGMALNVLLMRLLLAIEARPPRGHRRQAPAPPPSSSEAIPPLAVVLLGRNALVGYHYGGVRRAELRKRVQSNVVGKGIAMVNMTTAYLFPVAGFWAYTVVSGKELTVDVAFPALDLFGMLQNSLRELPDLVTIFLNSRVAMGRIEEFMLEPEKEEDLEVDLIGLGVGGEFGSAGGAGDRAQRCDLLVAGGDEERAEGCVHHMRAGLDGRVCIRQNILFSAVYDKARFEQVIDACCLRDDLNMFRCKDLTLIGENGVGLSGGQRARVALARAVYMSGPHLAARRPHRGLVDHHTATAILKNLFGAKNSPLMAGRLVIFVTHRVDIVTPYAYQIIEVDKGGRVESFDKKDLENNEEELEHLAEIADAAASGGETTAAVEEDEPIPDKFIEDEHRVHGGVLASVYWQYVKAGKLRWWVTMVGFFTLFRIAKIGYFWFLKEWGEQYPGTPEVPPPGGLGYGLEYAPSVAASQRILQRQSVADPGWFDLGGYLPPPSENVQPWLFGFLHPVYDPGVHSNYVRCGACGHHLQSRQEPLRESHAPSNQRHLPGFYDVTPVGRLMNRLTSDMGTIDGQIAGQLMSVAWYSLGWLTSMAVISTTTPTFLVISIAMTALFVFIFDRFLPASQSLRRLETVSLSPLFSNFGTLVEGLTTVRAFRSEPHFQNRIITSCDAFQKMDHIRANWCWKRHSDGKMGREN
ncbi:hypothetical protein CHGG_04374 [Chaetomium globosum CBS 148.51]|uniref:ABC transmembrane type-1 domain-containing protein n=1 Tax=Chaetomium globosum (strain ATCC 6205 / CBS 148.51 / DSM 1962 / NBRC 6347 / NRRL 1970) TaxID=306901 RepID=Q2H1H2_CHAGB|nr:uncharacterized protein CHGG_04374 [Chaetomium globosum CBS 148.51]EAQ87755.1 hypothetical protein CHGG_04374 [Chaetomium globosum CBS 148.51]